MRADAKERSVGRRAWRDEVLPLGQPGCIGAWMAVVALLATATPPALALSPGSIPAAPSSASTASYGGAGERGTHAVRHERPPPLAAGPGSASGFALDSFLSWLMRLVSGEQGDAPATGPGSGRGAVTPPDSGAWTLAFSDEFNDTVFDTSKWDWRYPRSGDMIYSNWGNGEAQWYKRENIVEGDGHLKLTAKREDTTSPYSGRTFLYSSGLIHSKPSFNFRYGYMEARMWLPKGSGFWPAFWTWPSNEQWPPEIDILEFYGDRPGRVNFAYYSGDGSEGSESEAEVTRSDWTAGWHKFGVKWEPGRLTWYVDGVARKAVSESPSLNMYLIANLAIASGERAPAPKPGTRFPSSLKVDYIRVWKRG